VANSEVGESDYLLLCRRDKWEQVRNNMSVCEILEDDQFLLKDAHGVGVSGTLMSRLL